MESIIITFDTVLQFFGAIAVIGGGVKIIVSAFSPYRDMKQKLKNHDKQFEENNKRIDGIEGTLERIEESQRLQGKALMELLNHIITGNHIDKLEGRYNDLMKHYIDQ